MWDKAVVNMILAGIGETLYMTLASTILGYVFGMPLGIALAVTDKTGIRPNAVVYKILDVVSNIIRSIPFLILLIVLIPFTRVVVGKSYGSTATIVPLVVAATPFIGRMVESSLKEVDCAASMTPPSTSFKEDSTILPIKGVAATTKGTIVAVEP